MSGIEGGRRIERSLRGVQVPREPAEVLKGKQRGHAHASGRRVAERRERRAGRGGLSEDELRTRLENVQAVVVRGGRVVREGEPEPPAADAVAPPPAPADGAEDPWTRLLAVRTLQEFQDEAEKLYLVAKLAENGGNVTRTAEAVDTPRSNLYKKMDRYGLKKREDGA